MFRPHYAQALVIAATLAVSSAPAFAASMRLLQNTNVYETADASSPAKYQYAAGTVLEVNCGSIGWCFVDTPAGGGYIPQSVVEAAPQAPQQPQQPNGGGNAFPGFNFDFNLGGDNRPPPRNPNFDDDDDEDDEICFYTSSNFKGRSFCAEPGDAANRLPSPWNDAISSIEVYGDAEVEVCTDRNLRGTCTTISRDTSRLSSRVNDKISSFEIY